MHHNAHRFVTDVCVCVVYASQVYMVWLLELSRLISWFVVRVVRARYAPSRLLIHQQHRHRHGRKHIRDAYDLPDRLI